MKQAMTLKTMLCALEQTVEEGAPFLVHARTLYNMSKIDRSTSQTDLAAALTATLEDYLVVYAADTYGATEDFVVFPAVTDVNKIHAVLAEIKDDPKSSCGDGVIPDWVEDWINVHRA